MKKIAAFASFLCIVTVLDSSPAYAYLDAGTGSMILQLILGGLAGLAVVLKVFWHRILGIFGIKHAEKEENNS